MGSVQLGFFGGELLICKDLLELICVVCDFGFYINLIIFGIGLMESKLDVFSEVGLDYIQISFQVSDEVFNVVLVGNKKVFQQKLIMVKVVKVCDYLMVFNFVFYWYNIDQFDKIIELCIELEVDDVELVICQFYGWVFFNCEGLLLIWEQIVCVEQVVVDYWQKMVVSGNFINLLFVILDYYEEWLKGCMGGWGLIFFSVILEGIVLFCYSVCQLLVVFLLVLEQSLELIWYDLFGFNCYCGYDWMLELCCFCDEKEKDFGGCCCQVFMLIGSVDNVDLVCSKFLYYYKIFEVRCEVVCSDIKVSQLQFCNCICLQLIY